MKLYGYYRSSAAYRVRIGAALKGIALDPVAVHLLHDGGAQNAPDFVRRNPQRLVPVLELDDGTVLTQSLAILEYFDQIRPDPPLLPVAAVARARVRALAQIVACDIHPLDNLRVLHYLETEIGLTNAARTTWYRHWIVAGFTALETLLAESADTGRFCHGDRPGLADICLVPQIYNARRFDVDMAAYPTLTRIDAACAELPAFVAARPERQPDAP